MSKSKLTAALVHGVREPGKYYDEFGLYLRVERTGRRYWEQRLTVRRLGGGPGRPRTMGLGPYPDIGLKAAREAALENLRLGYRGDDPKLLRKRARVPTLIEAAQAVLELHAPNWSNARQAKIWYGSLEQYVFPRLGDSLVSDITSDDLLAVLEPIWTSRNDTARRVRHRVGAILKWAIAQRYRTDNPADVVALALPRVKRSKSHYPALPHSEVAAALDLVRRSDAFVSTRLAFEYLVLTSARSGEVRSALWEEVDLETAMWTVPASRMKARVEHRVPLSGRSLAVLREARERSPRGGLVFQSRAGEVMSDNTLSCLLRRLRIGAVPHGFRSSFRDWCGDTGVPRELAEACLAHVVANKVEAAYARSDLYNRRVLVMERWAEYLTCGTGS